MGRKNDTCVNYRRSQSSPFFSDSDFTQYFVLIYILRINALQGIEVPLLQIDFDGNVVQKTLTLDEIMKKMRWTDEKGKKHKMPLHDLRCFLPTQGINEKSIEKEIVLPTIMPRSKQSKRIIVKCNLI